MTNFWNSFSSLCNCWKMISRIMVVCQFKIYFRFFTKAVSEQGLQGFAQEGKGGNYIMVAMMPNISISGRWWHDFLFTVYDTSGLLTMYIKYPDEYSGWMHLWTKDGELPWNHFAISTICDWLSTLIVKNRSLQEKYWTLYGFEAVLFPFVWTVHIF